jgi:hypothetical protein
MTFGQIRHGISYNKKVYKDLHATEIFDVACGRVENILNRFGGVWAYRDECCVYMTRIKIECLRDWNSTTEF